MNIKLDENLGRRGAAILRAAGHQVTTVAEEGLSAASDEQLAEVCRSDRKCLGRSTWTSATLFDSLRRAIPASRPSDCRAGRAPETCFRQSALWPPGLRGVPSTASLWIVQRGHIREYQEQENG